MNRNFLLLLFVVFIVLCGLSYLLQTAVPGLPLSVLLVGNIAIALVTLISHQVAASKIQSRPQAFVGGVTGASLLKMMVIIGLVLLYVLAFRDYYHKGALFVVLGFYMVYTLVEAISLSKLAKRKS